MTTSLARSEARLRERGSVMRRYGMDIDVSSVNDLIRMKRASGREKDLTHLRLLLEFLDKKKGSDS